IKFGTTQTSRIDSGSNKKSASRRLGSSFQKAHPTSAKISRRRISAACASVGALESGFTVEPWATMRSAILSFRAIQQRQRPTLNAQRPMFNLRQTLWFGIHADSTAGKRGRNTFLESLL